MSYLRKRIDTRSLDEETRRQVCALIEANMTIYTADLAHPGVYFAELQEEELAILDNPLFRGCVITDA